MAMNDFERLENMARERRCTISQQASGKYAVFNRNNNLVHMGEQLADMEAFLKTMALQPPDPKTKMRVLIAASNKKGFFVEEIGEDEYRLSLKGRHHEVIFESENFVELIQWLDQQSARQ
jgi:hypothetical protein